MQILGKTVELLLHMLRLLIDTSRFVRSRINDGKVLLVDKEIVGDLNFIRNETK